jgi:hypothetical protein
VISRTRIAGGLAAGLALLLAGCAGSAPNSVGPFGGAPKSSIGECLFAPRGSVATLAASAFANSGGPGRISKITLVDPHDIKIVTAWVVPDTGLDLIGVFAGYPPLGIKGLGPPSIPPGIQWRHRQRADGALIPHTPGQDSINLVLVLKASGVKGTVKDVYIYYEAGGNNYRLDLAFAIQLFNGNKHGCRPANAG